MNIPEYAGAHTSDIPSLVLMCYAIDHILVKMRLFWQQPAVLFFVFQE